MSNHFSRLHFCTKYPTTNECMITIQKVCFCFLSCRALGISYCLSICIILINFPIVASPLARGTITVSKNTNGIANLCHCNLHCG